MKDVCLPTPLAGRKCDAAGGVSQVGIWMRTVKETVLSKYLLGGSVPLGSCRTTGKVVEGLLIRGDVPQPGPRLQLRAGLLEAMLCTVRSGEVDGAAQYHRSTQGSRSAWPVRPLAGSPLALGYRGSFLRQTP